ncbi:XrtA/PEP-CTERM system TPR-repeat protein PrsT [Pseudocolwellia sp. HL-MZ7]|uniref:XrtA/PEP-CTERM system TPR-repeat protein PrsT n=1 Tax=Pseudocolwellia sp. HL-MZ7 TaxID=3400627 RepID=UPI003CEB70E7
MKLGLLHSVLFFLSFTAVANNNSTYEDALNSYNASDYDASMIHLKNALKAQPEHLPSIVLFAENLLAKGESEQAEILLIDAKHQGADETRLLPLFAKTYLMQRRYDEVLELITPYNANSRYKSEMLTFNGLALLGKKEYAESSEAFEQALKISPVNSNAMLGYATLELERNNINAAKSWINKALSLAPEGKQVLITAAIIYKKNNDVTQAFNLIQRLLALEENNYNGLLIRSVLLTDQGKYQEALDDINKIIEVIPNEPVTNYIKSLSSLSLGDEKSYTVANEHLKNIINGLPEELIEQQPIYLFIDGVVNFRQNLMEKADDSLSKYNKKQPKDITAIKLLARTKLALGSYGTAQKLLRKVHLDNPNDIEILSLLARSYILLGNNVRAEHYFTEALRFSPNNTDSTLDLAKLLILQQKFYQASELIRKQWLEIQPSPQQEIELLFILTKSYKELRQYKAGLIQAKKLIELAPENSSAHEILGTFYGVTGDLVNAKKSYQQAISLNQNNFTAVTLLARIYFNNNEQEQAIDLIKEQLELGDNSALFIELAEMYQVQKMNEQAMQLYEKALIHNPSSVLALTRLTQIHLANNNSKKAIALVQAYLEKYNENSDIHHLAAQLYIKTGQQKEALYEMSQAVTYADQKGERLYLLAQLQLSYGDRNAAVINLQRAISWQNSYVPAYVLLITIYNENKDQALSESYIDKLANISDDNSLINRLRGDMYWVLNDLDSATKSFKSSHKQQANKQALIGLYRIYRRQQNFDNISTLLDEWLVNNPDDQMAVVLLGENYRDKGEKAKAAKYYQQLVTQYPTNAILLNNAALTSLAIGELDKANGYAETAYEIAKTNVHIIDTKAWLAFHNEQYKQALDLLRQANTLDYEDAEIKYHLALTLDKLGKRAEAKIYLENTVNSKQPFRDKELARTLLATW